MRNYLFYDEETGEQFFVQENNGLSAANEIAHQYFKRPFFMTDMNDAEAEVYGFDTY